MAQRKNKIIYKLDPGKCYDQLMINLYLITLDKVYKYVLFTATTILRLIIISLLDYHGHYQEISR